MTDEGREKYASIFLESLCPALTSLHPALMSGTANAGCASRECRVQSERSSILPQTSRAAVAPINCMSGAG